SDALSVSLADVLPAQLQGAKFCEGVACDPSTGSSWSSPYGLDVIAAGGSKTVRIVAKVDPSTLVASISNTATVSTSTNELNTANNSSHEATTVHRPGADSS